MSTRESCTSKSCVVFLFIEMPHISLGELFISLIVQEGGRLVGFFFLSNLNCFSL